MSEFEEIIAIEASPEKVWVVLADIGNIYLWNPGIVHSEQTSSGTVGVGSCRRCVLGYKNYLDEEVVVFEPSRQMTIRITDTNLPFKTADIRFTLEPDGNKTIVKVSPKYRLKFGLLGRVLDDVMVRNQYRKGMRGLLRGLKDHVENKTAS
ncbi:MAG: SRPBCC family protein [Gammaproteobacteria bacterium]